jgi:hypothetical protein
MYGISAHLLLEIRLPVPEYGKFSAEEVRLQADRAAHFEAALSGLSLRYSALGLEPELAVRRLAAALALLSAHLVLQLERSRGADLVDEATG